MQLNPGSYLIYNQLQTEMSTNFDENPVFFT